MKIKLALLTFPLLAQSFNSQLNSVYKANDQQTISSPSVTVSATIGVPKMTIWGYGPPQSLVELNGIGVSEQTLSDGSGYYLFSEVYLPLPVASVNYHPTSFNEVCITAIDGARRITPPTCIPPIPFGQYYFDIGPVILPPTISIGNGQAVLGSQVAASGSTIPNSDINILMARSGTIPLLSLNKLMAVTEVRAAYVPSYAIKSDALGTFSFNLPTTESDTWRVFAITKYQAAALSPKSNTLKFEVIPLYVSFWQKIVSFISSLLVWPRILILELLIILLLSLVILSSRRRDKRHSKVTFTR